MANGSTKKETHDAIAMVPHYAAVLQDGRMRLTAAPSQNQEGLLLIRAGRAVSHFSWWKGPGATKIVYLEYMVPVQLAESRAAKSMTPRSVYTYRSDSRRWVELPAPLSIQIDFPDSRSPLAEFQVRLPATPEAQDSHVEIYDRRVDIVTRADRVLTAREDIQHIVHQFEFEAVDF